MGAFFSSDSSEEDGGPGRQKLKIIEDKDPYGSIVVPRLLGIQWNTRKNRKKWADRKTLMAVPYFLSLPIFSSFPRKIKDLADVGQKFRKTKIIMIPL